MVTKELADSTIQRSFTFINYTENPDLTDQKDDDKPTIRSHAMREVLKRKKLRAGTPNLPKRRIQPYIQPYIIAKDSDHFRFPLSASQSQGIKCSRTFANPYCGTAIELNSLPGDFSLPLHYFVHGFTPLTFPTTHVRYQCDIMRIALSEGDLALLHALSAISTIHRALVRETTILSNSSKNSEDEDKIARAFLYHKQCAITSLRTNLSKPASLQSQSSLAIVALLLMNESLSGDVATANAHRSGLLELVKCYGRTQELSNFMDADLLMSDIKSAASSLSQPSMSPCSNWVSDFHRLKHLPFVPHRPDLASLGSGFLVTRVNQHLGSAFILLICGMRNLVNAVEQNFDLGIDVSDADGTHFLVIEHQLLTIQNNTGGNGVFSGKLAECCRIGMLLYCNLCLWSWPKNSTLVKSLLSHFRTAISQWKPEPGALEQFSVLLWLYFIGSFATSDPEERQWYLTSVENVSKSLGVEDETQFHLILAKFLYVDRLLGQHMKLCYKFTQLHPQIKTVENLPINGPNLS